MCGKIGVFAKAPLKGELSSECETEGYHTSETERVCSHAKRGCCISAAAPVRVSEAYFAAYQSADG